VLLKVQDSDLSGNFVGAIILCETMERGLRGLIDITLNAKHRYGGAQACGLIELAKK